jgi:hypothetical protein
MIPRPRSRTDYVKDQETEKAAKAQHRAVEPETDRYFLQLENDHFLPYPFQFAVR